MKLVHVVAIITTKPGMRGRVLEMFLENVPNVHAENGCIEYQATIDAGDAPGFQTKFGEDTFVVIEKWESMEALQAHANAPHMAEYASRSREMIADRAVHVLSAAQHTPG